MARRSRRSNAWASQMIQKVEERSAMGSFETPPSTPSQVVSCVRHEERKLGSPACLLSGSLRGVFSENALLRIVSKTQPDLSLFTRVTPQNFSDSVRGVSIFRKVAEAAKLVDKEVELRQVVDEKEAELKEVIMVLYNRYVSKRDIWQLHLTMMSEDAQVIYSGYEHNFDIHIYKSSIERLKGGESGPPVSGRVTPRTEVIFKSGTALLAVLVQLSSELQAFNPVGQSYLDVLLDCFEELVDKSLRVKGVDVGHYLRIVLFARSRQPVEEHTDFYEVLWEGPARVLPPTHQLLAQIRQVGMQLWRSNHVAPDRENKVGWHGIQPEHLVEASDGNVFEALNLELDQYDLHYLDRALTVTGQMLVLVTAGNGLFRPSNKKVYELTNRRFVKAGPSTSKAFYMICVRQPPLHHVPWVHWPGGSVPTDTIPIETMLTNDDSSQEVPVCPSWIELVFFKEVEFCPCRPNIEWTHSSLLSAEDASSGSGDLFVPRWGDAAKSIVEEPCAAKFSPMPQTRWKMRSRLQGLGKFQEAGQELWNEVRAPTLRPYYNRVSVSELQALNEEFAHTLDRPYSIAPSRFSYNGMEREKVNTMNDLVGCRLEARTSELLYLVGTAGSMDQAIVRATDRTMCWRFKPEDLALSIKHMDQTVHGDPLKYPYRCCIRRRSPPTGPRGTISESDDGVDASEATALKAEAMHRRWVPIQRIFHLPVRPHWNTVDSILAADRDDANYIPPAIPYPVDPDCTTSGEDRCPGWQLRSAIKQHLYVLIPEDVAGSHARYLDNILRASGKDSLTLGVDPFLLLEQEHLRGEWFSSPEEQAFRNKLTERFRNIITGLNELCFGGLHASESAAKGAKHDGVVNVRMISDGSCYKVERNHCTVYTRDMKIPTAHATSRDWVEIYYDSVYSAPTPFLLVLQWMVCSSAHLVNFLNKFMRIAEDNGFLMAKLTIAQLFPPPAPHYVWTDERETNFDRLAFNAPLKMEWPNKLSQEDRERLHVSLLKAWMKPPLNCFLLFTADNPDFKIIPGGNGSWTPEEILAVQNKELHQRIAGWVLCHEDVLFLIMLRDAHIVWHINRCVLQVWKTAENDTLSRISKLKLAFLRITLDIFEQAGMDGVEVASQASSDGLESNFVTNRKSTG